MYFLVPFNNVFKNTSLTRRQATNIRRFHGIFLVLSFSTIQWIKMDEPRPTLTASSSRSDEVDAFQFRRANPDAKVLKNLLENEALGTKKNSPKIMSHITTAKMFCQDVNIDNEDISEMYFRFNRMRQEQNIFRKSSGKSEILF